MKPSTRRRVAQIQKLRKRVGFDCDYLDDLNEEELKFLEAFAERYYSGHPDQPTEHKKEANRRRNSVRNEAIFFVNSSVVADSINDLDPEKILLLKEELKKK
jgi:hypothetical protein